MKRSSGGVSGIAEVVDGASDGLDDGAATDDGACELVAGFAADKGVGFAIIAATTGATKKTERMPKAPRVGGLTVRVARRLVRIAVNRRFIMPTLPVPSRRAADDVRSRSNHACQ